MPLAFVQIPLSAEQLRELSQLGYSIIDQAARTPGLLIVQAPDQATGAGRQATDETEVTEVTEVTAVSADGAARTPPHGARPADLTPDA
jgi:hypothetical protein